MKKENLKVIRAAAAVVFVFAFLLNVHTNIDGRTTWVGQPLIGQTEGTGTGTDTIPVNTSTITDSDGNIVCPQIVTTGPSKITYVCQRKDSGERDSNGETWPCDVPAETTCSYTSDNPS